MLQPYLQTLDIAGKACQGQALWIIKFVNYGREKFYDKNIE